jgi:hypothetical protein
MTPKDGEVDRRAAPVARLHVLFFMSCRVERAILSLGKVGRVHLYRLG